MKTIAPHGLNLKNFTVTLLAGLLIAGCATSAFESRKQEEISTYRTLSPEMRAAVDKGQLKEGMDTNTVYIAWGKPTEVLPGGNGSQETTTWVYRQSYIQKQNFAGTYQDRGALSAQTYVRAQVIFVNGAVQKWQTFPKPPY